MDASLNDHVRITIHDGPLETLTGQSAKGASNLPAGTGAAVCFEGIVRPMEAGVAIAGLDYEVYDPMATQQLETLATELIASHGLLGVKVEHSRGHLPVGACSFRLRIFAAHRKEALAAMDEFIDRMKRDVPIWKAVAG